MAAKREFHSDDPVEDGLLEAIWQAPTDDHARAVYKDWLEQHGHAERLNVLQAEDAGRTHLTSSEDARWRAVVTRPVIRNCPRSCMARWHELARTDSDVQRTCETCKQRVMYCTSTAAPPIPFALDCAIDPRHLNIYNMPRGNPPPPQNYRPALPIPITPPPVPSPNTPPRPGAIVRVLDWFRRRKP